MLTYGVAPGAISRSLCSTSASASARWLKNALSSPLDRRRPTSAAWSLRSKTDTADRSRREASCSCLSCSSSSSIYPEKQGQLTVAVDVNGEHCGQDREQHCGRVSINDVHLFICETQASVTSTLFHRYPGRDDAIICGTTYVPKGLDRRQPLCGAPGAELCCLSNVNFSRAAVSHLIPAAGLAVHPVVVKIFRLGTLPAAQQQVTVARCVTSTSAYLQQRSDVHRKDICVGTLSATRPTQSR